MTITLYDLAGADPSLRFSPYCWRTKLALAHKGLRYETIPWRFTDKTALQDAAGAEKVPALLDRGRPVHDSWDIAEYLETQYADRPSLFGGPSGLAHARFINAWADSVMIAGIARLVVRDVWVAIAPVDQTYFRSSREARLAATLEDVVADRDRAVVGFREALAPLRRVLRQQTWLGGASPSYADYIVFGSLQWARCISHFAVLLPDDPLLAWQERMLDLFDGLARKAVRVPG